MPGVHQPAEKRRCSARADAGAGHYLSGSQSTKIGRRGHRAVARIKKATPKSSPTSASRVHDHGALSLRARSTTTLMSRIRCQAVSLADAGGRHADGTVVRREVRSFGESRSATPEVSPNGGRSRSPSFMIGPMDPARFCAEAAPTSEGASSMVKPALVVARPAWDPSAFAAYNVSGEMAKRRTKRFVV